MTTPSEEALKLFVWEGNGVLQDYTSGMICVLARSLDEALKLIQEKDSCTETNFHPWKYKVVTQPEAFVCWGGG